MSIEETGVTIVIPTYGRELVLLDTIEYLLKLEPPPSEIIVADQTKSHEEATIERLAHFDREGAIKWIRLDQPSIPAAMNVGLLKAAYDIVLFLDDDIIPSENLIMAHMNSRGIEGVGVVAGKVIQPWDTGNTDPADGEFRFTSGTKQFITEFMGGNFSVKRSLALKLGGFDENFVHAAYRFEREFAERILDGGLKILFEPAAEIQHLRAASGGTRAYGDFLRTMKPSHAIGEYYFLLRSRHEKYKILKLLWHPLRAVRTKHHLKHPWWMPVTLIAELRAFLWAAFLALRGARLISRDKNSGVGE